MMPRTTCIYWFIYMMINMMIYYSSINWNNMFYIMTYLLMAYSFLWTFHYWCTWCLWHTWITHIFTIHFIFVSNYFFFIRIIHKHKNYPFYFIICKRDSFVCDICLKWHFHITIFHHFHHFFHFFKLS